MSQIKFKADITAAEFPMLYDWSARTVTQPQFGDGVRTDPVITPQILYCEDVLPTQQGYKSVSYKQLIGAASPANINFSNIFTVSDPAQNKALIGVTLDSHIYILTAALPTWVDVTPVGWAGGDAVTTGNANGTYYLYLANKGCYAVNITGVALVATTLTGITAANILGMSSAVDYLLLWDTNGTVYWDGTTVLDFTPSLITGAGSAIPYDLNGKIITIVPLNNGYAVYSTANIVLASFSNNTQFPWIFRNATNSSGISNYKQVSFGHDLAFHVAITYAGILQVTPQGCTIVTPEVTDFLAAKTYESYDRSTDTIIKTDLAAVLNTRITVLGARWIVVSYGITGYTDAIVYDTGLKRWGKLHCNHTCVFEIETNMEGVIAAYNGAGEVGSTYASASPQTYNSTAVNISLPPNIGRIFGILATDGTVSLANLNYASIADTAILVLGKYQSVRDYLLSLIEIAVETIPVGNTGFVLKTISSINGRDLLPSVMPTLVEDGTNMQRYGCRVVGKNHLLVFMNSFNLTSVEITATLESRR